MSLYPPHSRRSPHFLALAAAQDVRLFTLTLRELNAKAVTVNLTVLYRIAVDNVPDYLLTLKPVPNGKPWLLMVGVFSYAQVFCMVLKG